MTCLFSAKLQSTLATDTADRLLQVNLDDVKSTINMSSDNNLSGICKLLSNEVEEGGSSVNNRQWLDHLKNKYEVSEIHVIDENEIIVASTDPAYLGFDMRSGTQSGNFMNLLKEKGSVVTPYQTISYGTQVSRKYAGMRISNAYVQISYDAKRFQEDIRSEVLNATKFWHVGEHGGVIISNASDVVISEQNGFAGKLLEEVVEKTGSATASGAFFAMINGEKYVCMTSPIEGFSVCAYMPYTETLFNRNVSVLIMAYMEILLFSAIFILIYLLVKKIVVENIHKINSSLSLISQGDLDVVMDVKSNEEFAYLSNDINRTVATLKKYIGEAEARMDKELVFAKQIQHNALPSVFPPYPDCKDFEIYASMNTAKEVGGDFYFINPTKFAFLIADVSGKGIPAALFMMKSKTLIKSLVESGLSPDQVFTRANEELCSSNEAGMFVTGWLGFLDLDTGLLTFVNGGHNPPLLKRFL